MKILFAIPFIAALSACATTSDVEQLKIDVQRAQATADAATQCCTANTTAIDRAFTKSQRK